MSTPSNNWVENEPSIVLCGNRNGHHSTELRHIIGQHRTQKKRKKKQTRGELRCSIRSFMYLFSRLYYLQAVMGPSWPWSNGSWIYNYLCNQCRSPHMLWVRIPLRARCTTLYNKVFPWLTNWPPRYSWNIIESGVKDHTTNQPTNQPTNQTVLICN